VYTSKIAMVQSLITLISVVIVSVLDLNMFVLVCFYVLASFFMLTSYLVYFILNIKDYKISLRLFDLTEIKKIIKFSLSVQAMSVFNALIDPLIKYIIGSYFSVSTVSSYEIARRFAIAISGLFFSAFKIVLPKASALKNEKEFKTFIGEDIVRFSGLGVVYSGVVFGIFALPIVLVINWIFNSHEALLIFVILALPESINNFGYAIYNFLLGVGKVTLLVFVQFNNLIFVVLSMSIGFIIFHNILGLIGYFISVVIGNLLMLFYLKKYWKISIMKLLIDCKIYKLLYLICFMCITVYALYLNILPYYINFGLLSIVCLIIFYYDIKTNYTLIIKPILKDKFSCCS
jgi:O-antigen/teichoic acid export membrane protein